MKSMAVGLSACSEQLASSDSDTESVPLQSEGNEMTTDDSEPGKFFLCGLY